jgi:hypothetical protein
MEYKMATKKKEKVTPSKRAVEAGMNNQDKVWKRVNARDRASDEKWDDRGASGAEMKAKEYAQTGAAFDDEYTGVMTGQENDTANAERYGRDAYISRGFGQGKKAKPENKGSLKYAAGGKTGMRGQVKKDDMNKKAVNSAVKEAMDSKYEGKINPPKEPDMGVAKARMSRPTGPDRKEMAYNRRRSASEGRTVSKMSMGGKCRGMGAATKGGSFSKNG